MLPIKPLFQGSVNLADYIGWESSFNLDRESHTLALVFKEMVVILALEAREALIKWQVSPLPPSISGTS